MSLKKQAEVDRERCVACGACMKQCPRNAIQVLRGRYAEVKEICVGCGICAKICPADCITVKERAAE